MENVTIYTTHCPKCNVLMKKLDSKNIQYVVQDSAEEMLSLGINEVPVLSVNGKLLSFAESITWINNQ